VEADSQAVERLQPQDQIKVVYQESVQFALQEPKQADPAAKTKVEDLTHLRGRDAVEFGRKVSTTVQILAVGANGSAVEFRAPEGQVRTVAIDDEESQRKIAALRPGDKVAVTYVEKLALALDETRAEKPSTDSEREAR
jgi:endonuclease/exonuclease/phosphatase family metal-dependent hydrolase